MNHPVHSSTIIVINPLNAELNPIYHLLALLGAHLILHVSKEENDGMSLQSVKQITRGRDKHIKYLIILLNFKD